METIKSMLQTHDQISGLIARLTLTTVILPHGVQQVFGWLGGYGFTGTMQYYTATEKLPWIIAFLVILLQSAGALLILTGTGTRIIAFSLIILFIGMILKSHSAHGFFMNWSGKQGGEGFEYHLLVIGLALILLINGAGQFSVDQLIARKMGLSIPASN